MIQRVSMSQPVEQIVRRKLSDEVFDRLERMITSGELKPGDDMPSERVLMERFGVGRPAIREAMQSLANMGLVAISHGERAKVLELTAQSIFRQVNSTAKIMLSRSSDSLEHLKNARIFFERGMAREAAAKATERDIEEHACLGERPGYNRVAAVVNDIPDGVCHQHQRGEHRAGRRAQGEGGYCHSPVRDQRH